MKTYLEQKRDYPEEVSYKPGPWSKELEELELFYKDNNLPDSIMIDKGCFITDVPKFLKSHLAIVKAQNGNGRFIPYLKRLIILKRLLTVNLDD